MTQTTDLHKDWGDLAAYVEAGSPIGRPAALEIFYRLRAAYDKPDPQTTNLDLIQIAILALAWLTPSSDNIQYHRGISALEDLKERLARQHKPLTQFPPRSLFLLAGISGANMVEIETRWPVLTEEERQQVLRRVLPLRDSPLEELLS